MTSISYIAVPKAFLEISRELGAAAGVLFVYLCERANDEGVAWPSNQTMMADTGLKRTTLKSAKRALLEAGYLSERSRYDSGRGQQSTLLLVRPLRDWLAARQRASEGVVDAPAVVTAAPELTDAEPGPSAHREPVQASNVVALRLPTVPSVVEEPGRCESPVELCADSDERCVLGASTERLTPRGRISTPPRSYSDPPGSAGDPPGVRIRPQNKTQDLFSTLEEGDGQRSAPPVEVVRSVVESPPATSTDIAVPPSIIHVVTLSDVELHLKFEPGATVPPETLAALRAARFACTNHGTKKRPDFHWYAIPSDEARAVLGRIHPSGEKVIQAAGKRRPKAPEEPRGEATGVPRPSLSPVAAEALELLRRQLGDENFERLFAGAVPISDGETVRLLTEDEMQALVLEKNHLPLFERAWRQVAPESNVTSFGTQLVRFVDTIVPVAFGGER